MSLQENIRNGLLSGGGFSAGTPKNTPTQYADRKTQCLENPTSLFFAENAQYSSDYFDAILLTVNDDGSQTQTSVRVRMADVVRPSAAIQRHFDDYKMVLFPDLFMDYVQPGTKLVASGSTWLCINPANIASVTANGIFRRCNAVWRHLDYYGNILEEPIIAENSRENANTPDSEDSLVVASGYFNIACQYNAQTAQIDDNTRMILGSKSYMVTGYSDFHTEFTGDYSTRRMLSFAVRVEESCDAMDDMVNRVAGGKALHWDLQINGQNALVAGESAKFSASARRNGYAVQSTDEHPISYQWSTSDDSVAAVASDGTVSAISEGNAVITVCLAENPAVAQEMVVAVGAAQGGPALRFLSTIPARLRPHEEIEIGVGLFENGIQKDAAAIITLSGAISGSYSYTTEDGTIIYPSGALYPTVTLYPGDKPQTLTVKCWGYSAAPLIITAAYNGLSVSAEIILEGI